MKTYVALMSPEPCRISPELAIWQFTPSHNPAILTSFSWAFTTLFWAAHAVGGNVDITVTSTGKIFYGVDPLLGGLLCEAFPEAIKRVERKPAPTFNVQPQSSPTGPRWIVRTHPLNNKPEIVFSVLNSDQHFSGAPEQAAEAFRAIGHALPADVHEKYKALVERSKAVANVPSLLDEQTRQYNRELDEKTEQAKLIGRG
jgi:hypothetical protein